MADCLDIATTKAATDANAKYASFAAALADILVKYKYKAEHIKKINAVKITDNGRDYFAEHIPEINYLLENIVGSAEKNNIRLIIGRSYIRIPCSQNSVLINGHNYMQLSRYPKKYYKGHLHGNLFTSYENAFIKAYSFPLLTNGIHIDIDDPPLANPPINMGNDILSVDDFEPVKPVAVDIKNEGFKLVVDTYIQNIKGITMFGPNLCFAMGEYSLSSGANIFKYSDPDGVSYALLSGAGGMELTSSSRIIEVVECNKCIVEPSDGLYKGLKINNTYNLKLHVYYYADKFFSALEESGKIVELDMRQPNSSAKTKSACPL
jgi:hypothetical protein